LLTSRIQQEIQVLRSDLHDDLACWRPHQAEPDWNAYAERVSVACLEGGFCMGPSSIR
jgi:hypothetical protein